MKHLEKFEREIIDLEKVHGKLAKVFNPHKAAISFKYEDGAVYRIGFSRQFGKATLDSNNSMSECERQPVGNNEQGGNKCLCVKHPLTAGSVIKVCEDCIKNRKW